MADRFHAVAGYPAGHFEELIRSRAPLLVTRQGRESAVLISASEWEGVQETLHLLGSRNNADKLFGAIAELDAGRGVERDPTVDAEDAQ
ncbi:type II toxin-antitoxin system Phd/YefM family antitoxin [Aurantimonas sp. HBX-1]|uniref:type II toxin-antitoxin system Phd/YefM family antitoxin n=1 Tax=Aurantimonas sp. HBX-1 TaxID=2906072 RepID=UPI001F1EE75D|nr:type II toxin-antitoxin system prevent-host-death family antitoxin [Aurantimonas sp. HBX-1]UIJ70748.1 type II toxin-antitoxin system prevent-host-death family antitoxin [Aurantimonas sp. HBX-1]